ncbi:ribosome biogenesis GTPase YlqF [Anaerostipes sp. MSJ-23]|uniref:ribosome biogenesis GTPase YlqF n=1 Tax=Anaerostipes sp. MSJ-23 TaxID=2841520 RepID=UPI001C11053C|nr:ribosome biogenesis GTPase YlqF [Anaerostipes sp. MSJ-23]MBU5460306.1 ribosome biogenesis GTPase YlqF [Anaerostipes sp. MSJ-23]
MDFQWYPGHMTKAKRMMQENMKLIDIMIELVDARIPLSSRNPDVDQLAAGKYRLILLNKSDMADERVTAQWEEYFKSKGFFVAKTNSKAGKGVKATQNIIMEACKEKLERDKKRGIKNRPIRAMIAGIPNVGKSTFINSLVGRACTKTGNKPGVTKGKQWIKLNKNIELLDTPGILWPKFEDQMVGLRLALIGSIRDEILNQDEMALELICYLKEHYPSILSDRYDVEESEDKVKILESIAINRNCKLKGDELDYTKASKILLEEFRNGKLGKISLEIPEVEEA